MTPRQRTLLIYLASGVSVLALVLLVVRFVPGRERAVEGRGPEDRPAASVGSDTRSLPRGVAEYVAGCGPERDLPSDPASLQEEVTRCLQALTSAIEAVMRSDTTRSWILEQHFSVHRRNVARLSETRRGAIPPAAVGEALGSAAVLLAYLWEVRYREVPGLAREVAEVRRSTRWIDDQVSLEDQRAEVEEVFDEAAAAIVLMARR